MSGGSTDGVAGGAAAAATVPGLQADDGVVVGYPAERGSRDPLTLGDDARLRSGTVVYSGSRIGARLQTGHHVVVREDNHIGDDVSIWSGTVVDYGCTIADRVKIHSNCYIAQFTQIDDDAFLAPGVVLANDLYPGDTASAQLMAGPVIGAGAQIGVGARILPYVTVGPGAIVGAGSVVTADIPAGVVAFGTPATPRGRVADLVPVDDRVEKAADGRPRLRRGAV